MRNHKLIFKLTVLLILTSCSQLPTNKETPKQGFEMTESILQLVKTSYSKGCIDGMNHLIPAKTKGIRLSICLKKASTHQVEIEKILTAPIHQQKNSSQN